MNELEKAKDELRAEFRDRHGAVEGSIQQLTKEVSELVGEIKVMIHKWDNVRQDTTELQHKTDSHGDRLTKAEVKIDAHQRSIDEWADVRKRVFTWIIIAVIGGSLAAAALINGG